MSLKRNVLVLNQDYSPLTVCSVERAFLLVFLNKAEMISPVPNVFLHTVDTSYQAPSVIKVSRYISVPYKGVILSRQNVFRRDNHECQYCGTNRDLTLDHLVPRSKGGTSSWKNLVTACKHCNAKKGDYSPGEVGMKLRKEPFKPSYIMFLKTSNGSVFDEWRPFLQLKSEAL